MDNPGIYAFLHKNYDTFKEKAKNKGFKRYLIEIIKENFLDDYLARKRHFIKQVSSLVLDDSIRQEDLKLLEDELIRVIISSMPDGATNEIPFYYSVWVKYGYGHGISEASVREKAKAFPGCFFINANLIQLEEKGLKLASIIRNIEKSRERGFLARIFFRK